MVYYMVIFSHRYHDSDSICIPGCSLIHMNIIMQCYWYQNYFKKSSLHKLLNNVFKGEVQ